MKKPIPIVVDITIGDQNKAKEALETLLILDEGINYEYLIQIGNRRYEPELHELILQFIGKKKSTVSYDLPHIKFPQELVDKECHQARRDNSFQISAGTKKNWFLTNLVILKSFGMFDRFVLLTPDAIITRNHWLKNIIQFEAQNNFPFLGFFRKVKMDDRYIKCGWSSVGLYDSHIFRQLFIKERFAERIRNPWKVERPEGHVWQSNYCLGQDWLSGFDLPLGYYLFALYCQHITKSDDPVRWDTLFDECVTDNIFATECPDDPMDTPGNDTLVRHAIGFSPSGKENLRHQYKNSEREKNQSPTEIRYEKILPLPLSGPKYNIIGDNIRKFSIEELHNMFIGERCFIIGNGPSLNETDLKKLKTEYTIGLNRIYLNFEKMGFQTTFLCATNPNVIRQFCNDIDLLNSINFYDIVVIT